MPAELQSLINYTNDQLESIGYWFDRVQATFWSLSDSLEAEGNSGSAARALVLRDHFRQLRNKYDSTTGLYRTRLIDTLQWINDNWPEGDGAEVTMAAILDALWESTPLETFFFVNDIDAMRAAIWNKEISEQRLADLYRHFSI